MNVKDVKDSTKKKVTGGNPCSAMKTRRNEIRVTFMGLRTRSLGSRRTQEERTWKK